MRFTDVAVLPPPIPGTRVLVGEGAPGVGRQRRSFGSATVAASSLRARPLRAVGRVFGNPSVRDTQLALAVVRAVDLAQLIVMSTLLFSRGGAALVATYGVIRTLVPAVGVPTVTALGYRLGPGALLRLVGAVAAAGSIAMAATVATGASVFWMLASAAVVSVAVGCFRPVISAELPSLVRSPDELLASNAATGFLDGASTLAGPVIGAAVAAMFGVPAVLVVTGAAMLSAGLLAGRVPSALATHTPSGERAPGRISEYAAGVRELAGNPAARLVTSLGAAQTFIRGAMSVIIVVFAIDVLSTGEHGLGALYGAMGVGGLVGLPVAVVVADRLGVHRSLAMGLSAWGAPLAVCALGASPVAALLLFGIIGVGNGLVDVSYYGVLQRAVSRRVLTRVLGVVEAILQAGIAAGAFAGAILLDALGPRSALLVAGIVLPALATIAMPRLWSYDRVLARRDGDIALLRTQECFAPLSMTALDHLADRMARVSFSAGQVIRTAGQPSGCYLLIEDGAVEIAVGDRVVAVLGVGQAFDDTGAVHDVPRAATVRARGAVSARAIVRSTFLASIAAR